jgi:peptidoglycan hydrolase-like protein with peptidoglycan-binding domain
MAGGGKGPSGSGSSALANLDTSSSWENRQVALKVLGYDPGAIDGKEGPATRVAIAAFQRDRGMDDNGKWTRATDAAVRRELANFVIEDGGFPWGQYKPGSREFVALFRAAAREAGFPDWWASSNGLEQIISRESRGWVGIPNYTYGDLQDDKSKWPAVWAELQSGKLSAPGAYSSIMGKTIKSSATGLGQLLLSNADRYYPAARFGIGVPLQEAVGALRYIKRRYGDPEKALNCYKVYCASPPCDTVYGSGPCLKVKKFKEGY